MSSATSQIVLSDSPDQLPDRNHPPPEGSDAPTGFELERSPVRLDSVRSGPPEAEETSP